MARPSGELLAGRGVHFDCEGCGDAVSWYGEYVRAAPSHGMCVTCAAAQGFRNDDVMLERKSARGWIRAAPPLLSRELRRLSAIRMAS